MIRKKIVATILSLIITLTVVTPVGALNKVDRIKGRDNYETVGKIADKKEYTSVVLVNMDNTVADGLSAAALAGAKDAVVLLTSTDYIPYETRYRLGKAKDVYIIGSEMAISESIETDLKNSDKNVIRIGGANRYETSYNVAKEVIGEKNAPMVFIANGVNGEADVVSSSPVAYREKAPILLTNGRNLTEDLKRIANKAGKRYIVGGTTAVSNSVKKSIKRSERIGGSNRYATNKLIVDKFYKNPKDFYIVNKDDYTIATAACSICTNTPLALVEYNRKIETIKNANKITALGEMTEATISSAIASAGGMGKFNYDWTKHRYIAHAMGGVDGKKYTNSRQAMEQNYKKGFRVFELDLSYSSDGELIAWHPNSNPEELEKMGMPREFAWRRPTLKEFKETKIYGKYNTMSFEDVVAFMKKHKDMYVVIDSKATKGYNIGELYDKIIQKAGADVLPRIIPQAYNGTSYDQIMRRYNFKSVILTCYSMYYIDEDKMTNLCTNEGVNVIAVDGEKYTKSFVDKCNAKGIKVYMHTYNDRKIVDAYKKNGVYGFYTDFLTP